MYEYSHIDDLNKIANCKMKYNQSILKYFLYVWLVLLYFIR